MLTQVMFYFLRHGETDWNKEHRAQGQRDVPLNRNGLEQASRACDLVKDLKIATICTSPLRRSMATAMLLQNAIGCRLKVIDELVECAWGDGEGQVKGQWFADWKAGLSHPQGAERYEEFIGRALCGINKALEQPGPVLIVSHGGVYWSIQENAGLGLESDIPNAVPVRHDPPRTGFTRSDNSQWMTTVLGNVG